MEEKDKLIKRERQLTALDVLARYRPQDIRGVFSCAGLVSGFVYFTLYVSPLFEWRILGAIPLTLCGLVVLAWSLFDDENEHP